MKEIKSNLENLGLKEEEIEIYLICLEYRELAISTISKLTKIGRVNCYYHADKLVSKGYLSIYQKKGTKIYVAENPRIFINKQQENLNIAKEVFPELVGMYSSSKSKPKIQFFEGKAGIKNIFSRFLIEKNSEIVSFSNFENLLNFFDDKEFLINHFKQRIDNNIKTRFISPRNDINEDFTKVIFEGYCDYRLLEIFLISSKEFFFNSEITIFSDSIAILNLNEENPVGVLIENKDLYQTQKAIFDLAWLGATSFIT